MTTHDGSDPSLRPTTLLNYERYLYIRLLLTREVNRLSLVLSYTGSREGRCGKKFDTKSMKSLTGILRTRDKPLENY